MQGIIASKLARDDVVETVQGALERSARLQNEGCTSSLPFIIEGWEK